MFIIPYYIETKSVENFKITKAWIFMAKGGTKLWETDEAKLSQTQIVESYLKPNGFHGKVFCVKDNTVYFEVDTIATCLQDFYTWTDFLDKGEGISDTFDVWRPYIWVGSATEGSDTNVEAGQKDEWGWDGEVKQTIIQKFWATVFTGLKRC